MTQLNYNERSWVIDLISEINLVSSNRTTFQFRATGEQTLTTSDGRLFPDLILQDENLNVIQGWECKFPDTSILDDDLLSNAKIKAETLNLESFLVWNVKEACLYLKNNDSGEFEPKKNWFTKKVNSREDVFSASQEWKKTLFEIMTDLRDLFNNGEIKTSFLTEAISQDFLNELIEKTYRNDIPIIKEKERSSSLFRSQIDNWWDFNLTSLSNDKYEAFSKIRFLKWINKIIFANTLNSYVDINSEINQINKVENTDELKKVFESITKEHNFNNIFGNEFEDETLSAESLSNLKILNQLIYSNKFTEDIKNLYVNLIENNVSKTNKKFHGLFTTPDKLAYLLIDLVVDNTNGYIIDPCCGSGTIIKNIRNFYENFEDPIDANEKIWGADKFDFPVQVSTISNLKPQLIGNILNIFTEDAFNLKSDKKIDFINPNKPSEKITKLLPKFDYVISNLPFVSFNKLNEYSGIDDNEMYNFQEISNENNFGARADLYFYLINHLKEILNDNGKAGFITSNSWLGTKEGINFKKLLLENFSIETIVISGDGKWFKNADIKTCLLIISKDMRNKSTKFVTLNKHIEKLSFDEIKKVKNDILLNKKSNIADINIHEKENFLEFVNSIGSSWMPLFVNTEWIDEEFQDKLIPLKSVFDITRGLRRGANKMFYVKSSIDIEEEYLTPLYKTSSDYNTLEIEPSEKFVAFNCNDNLEFLKQNKPKAYSWIRQFELKTNSKGIPLPQVLKQNEESDWYKLTQMPFSDFVISLNPYEKILVFKPSIKGIIDQRFMCMTIKEPSSYNTNLLHALLNSFIFQFFVEASGFGRGLGALDINATNLSKLMFLDPKLLNEKQIKHLLQLFEPLKNRVHENLEKEVLKKDRIKFEEYILDSYEFDINYDQISKSLTSLHQIRVKE